MGKPFNAPFSRRERQIMVAIYALGDAGVSEVVAAIGEPEAYDSVRVTLGILERKGHLKRRADGNRNIYAPTVSAEKARRSAMRHLVETFFAGSSSRAILAFLDLTGHRLSERELKEIAGWIDERREQEP
jgi:predicted transcriptional regulator